MRKICFLILSLLFIQTILSAQENTYKHDLGISIFLLNWGSPSVNGDFDMELVYRRKLKVGKFRAKFGIDNRTLIYPNFGRIAASKTSLSDTTGLLVVSEFDQRTNYSLSLGYEKDWITYNQFSLIGAIDFFGKIRNADVIASERIERTVGVETREIIELLDQATFSTSNLELGIVLTLGFSIQITDRINGRVNFGANGNLLYQDLPYWDANKEKQTFEKVITTGDLLVFQDLVFTYSF